MKFVIAGGTGFIGKALTKELLIKGHEVTILTRNEGRTDLDTSIRYVTWLTGNSNPADFLQGTDVFVNLAGESINSGRWTAKRKKRILNSRIQAVEELMAIMKKLDKPLTLINASAVGYYGTSVNNNFSEEDPPFKEDFLSQTVKEWEKSALKASQCGIRTVLCRFGLVLDKKEGALPKMVLPYKAFAGGPVGSGNQWMSWIHIEDAVKALLFVANHSKMEGPVNFTAPSPVNMKQFSRVLSTVLRRPGNVSVPGFILKILLGEMSTLALEGQRVLPKKLLDNEFEFSFPELDQALKNIFYE